VLSPVGDHILQKFNTLYLTRLRTYKISRTPPKQVGEGFNTLYLTRLRTYKISRTPPKQNLVGEGASDR
jgi:hypothetical protein